MKKILFALTCFFTMYSHSYATEPLSFEEEVRKASLVEYITIDNDEERTLFLFKRAGKNYQADCNTEELQSFISSLNNKQKVQMITQMGSRRSSFNETLIQTTAKDGFKFVMLSNHSRLNLIAKVIE